MKEQKTPITDGIEGAARAIADAGTQEPLATTPVDLVSVLSQPPGVLAGARRRRMPKRLLVLDLSLATPRAVEVRRTGKNRYLATTSFTLPVEPPEGNISDPSFLTALHDQIIKNDVESRHVAVILPDGLVHHGSTSLPPLGRRALRGIIRQKARQIDGLRDTELIVGLRAARAAARTPGVHTLWAAAPKPDLLMACRGLREIGLDPIAFYPCVAALHQIYQTLSGTDDEGCVAVAQICTGEARFILVHGNLVYYDRAFRMESDDLECSRLTLIRQVHRTLLHHTQQRPDYPLSRVILLDEDARRADWIASDFARELVVPVQIARPTQLLSAGDAESWEGPATLAGALQLCASRDADSMNILPREVRARRRSTAMALSSVVLAGAGLFAAWAGSRQLQVANDRTRMLLAATTQATGKLAGARAEYSAMENLRAEAQRQVQCLENTTQAELRAASLLGALAGAVSPEMAIDSITMHVPSAPDSHGHERVTVEVEIQGRCRAGVLEAQQLVGALVRQLKAPGLLETLQNEPLRAPRSRQSTGEIPFVLTGRLSRH